MSESSSLRGNPWQAVPTHADCAEHERGPADPLKADRKFNFDPRRGLLTPENMTGAGGTWDEASNSIVCAADGPESGALPYVLTSALGASDWDIRPEMCDVEYDVEVGRVAAAVDSPVDTCTTKPLICYVPRRSKEPPRRTWPPMPRL